MAIITRKPRNSSLRFQTFVDTSDITKKNPEKSLVIGLNENVVDEMLMVELLFVIVVVVLIQKYRIIDFKRSDRDVPGKVIAVEYDPNRNVRIGLVHYENGAKSIYFNA